MLPKPVKTPDTRFTHYTGIYATSGRSLNKVMALLEDPDCPADKPNYFIAPLLFAGDVFRLQSEKEKEPDDIREEIRAESTKAAQLQFKVKTSQKGFYR